MKKPDLARIYQVHIGDLSCTAIDYKKKNKAEVLDLILQAVSIQLPICTYRTLIGGLSGQQKVSSSVL